LGRLEIVGVGGDALTQLLVGALHLRVVAIHVLAGESEELFVVGAFEPVTAGAIDRFHHVLLSALYALTVVPWAPNLAALRRVSSNLERA
jgi:hypothetical protein